MPISAQRIADRIRTGLDAEGSDHYRDDVDMVPAINQAQGFIISLVNQARSENKLSVEVFQDLQHIDVFNLSKDSRLGLDKFPKTVWTILAVYPVPTVAIKKNAVNPPPNPDNKDGIFRNDVYHISSEHSATRLTEEEWANRKRNPFQPGYDGPELCGDLIQYAYLDPFNYEPNNIVDEIVRQIEVSPALNEGECSIAYAREPDDITALTENIRFPVTVLNLFVEVGLAFIAKKQGDGTNLAALSAQGIGLLLRSIT